VYVADLRLATGARSSKDQILSKDAAIYKRMEQASNKQKDTQHKMRAAITNDKPLVLLTLILY
jgi:hypothetical protein